jgi:hypothetical protein
MEAGESDVNKSLSEFAAWLTAGGPDVLLLEPAIASLQVRTFLSYLEQQGLALAALVEDQQALARWLQRYRAYRETLTDRPEDFSSVQTSIRLFVGFLQIPDDGPEGETADEKNRTATPRANAAIR